MQLVKLPFILVLLFSFSSSVAGQKAEPPFLKYMNHPWVDSVLGTLTTDQRIAQCIWIAGWSDRDISHEVEITDIIKEYGVGGIVFFQGIPEKQIELTNYYQKISKVPLLIAMDAEWGIGMRLNNTEKFPYQLTLGAIRNDTLIYQFGKAVAEQCRRIGVNVNLAPVADINNNPENPVINYRAFGEDRENVASKSIIYMKALQENGVMATAKHFPGHGDTDVDSHSDLPVIRHSVERLDSLELYPFKRLISAGTGCIMTAHLNLPSFDSSMNLPSSLSSKIIKKLLKEKLGFQGIVISDAMNMKGVTKFFKPGEAEAKAFEAGNDVIEFVPDVEAALKEIKNLTGKNRISQEEIDSKCRKVLALKYWAGLSKVQTIDKTNISDDLNSGQTRALIRNLYANALTLLKNDQSIIPIKNLEKLRIATVAINSKTVTLYQKRIADYQPADHYCIDPADKDSVTVILKKLEGYDIVIAGVFGLDQRPGRAFGITQELITFLEKMTGSFRTIVTWFGNPYGIDMIRSLEKVNGLLLAYQENDYTEDLSAQLIFGGIGARGSLPVTINQTWPYNFGLVTPGNIRMQYGFPESAGMSTQFLERKIDSIVNAGIMLKAFPGCEVMVARQGIVVFRKAYGYQTYENRIAVREDDLYDIASLTKISATIPGFMLLDGEGKFSPDKTLGEYLPFFKRSDKANLRFSEILAHQAGLEAWIPYWKETVKKNGEFKRKIYRSEESEKFPLEVAEGLYITRKYQKKIFAEIKNSPLSDKTFRYSDLGFIVSPEIIDNLSGEKWFDFVASNLYHKIGAYDIGFNPWQTYPLTRIVPTEYDSLFRKQLLHGTVHDEGAAMLGGIAGHAGLFATSNDLMKLMEVYRRMGSYGGEQIISNEVMERYTRTQFPENKNRRGLGFDKPLLNNSGLSQEDAYPAKSSSPSSFGHSGYTGGFVWIDPEYEITYVFLSNRVYPSRNNTMITRLNIRTKILQVLYDSILR